LLPLSLVPGVITAWAGAIGGVPHGWFLCDGTNGTPDLRDKFLVSDGPNFSVGDEGGSETHIHPFTSDEHQHSIQVALGINAGGSASNLTRYAVATGTTDPSSSLPKYWALAYIQYQGV